MSMKRKASGPDLRYGLRAYKAARPAGVSQAQARGAVANLPGGAYRAARGLRLEPKTVDSSFSLNFDSNSAVANSMKLLNTIPTGTSAITRVGKRVCLKSVLIRGSIEAAGATIGEKCALLLIYIRNPNQAATLPAWTEILTSQSSVALTNRDNASKFKIVRRWDYDVIGNTTTPATGSEIITVNEFVKLKDLPSVWTSASTAGTIGEFEEGALILASVGKQANGATTTPTIAGNARVYFEDK